MTTDDSCLHISTRSVVATSFLLVLVDRRRHRRIIWLMTQQSFDNRIITSAEEGGYVFGAVCLSVCLSVGLLANLWMDFDEIFWRGRAWLKNQVIQFWWRSGSRFGSGSPKSEIRILRIGGGLCSLSAFLVIISVHNDNDPFIHTRCYKTNKHPFNGPLSRTTPVIQYQPGFTGIYFRQMSISNIPYKRKKINIK